jgi:hypothetical protein
MGIPASFFKYIFRISSDFTWNYSNLNDYCGDISNSLLRYPGGHYSETIQCLNPLAVPLGLLLIQCEELLETYFQGIEERFMQIAPNFFQIFILFQEKFVKPAPIHNGSRRGSSH